MLKILNAFLFIVIIGFLLKYFSLFPFEKNYLIELSNASQAVCGCVRNHKCFEDEHKKFLTILSEFKRSSPQSREREKVQLITNKVSHCHYEHQHQPLN